MATLQVAPTRHCHTEQLFGILTYQYLALTSRGREGWEKTKAKNGTQTTSYCKALCEELQASNCI